MNRDIKLPTVREASTGLGYRCVADMYASGETPESMAKAHRVALANDEVIKAVNYLVCASALSAGYSRAQMYEEMARDILAREQQCRRWELSLTMSHRKTDALKVVVQEKPARSPEVAAEFHVWIAGGALSNGADLHICHSAEEAHAFAMSELGAALGESL